MKLLLDTHVIIWWLYEPQRLGKQVSAALLDASTAVYASSLSAWEIARKQHAGKLLFDTAFINTFETRVEELGWQQLPLTVRHARTAARLPSDHKDPIDRLLAGQTSVEGLTMVTIDPAFKTFGISTFW